MKVIEFTPLELINMIDNSKERENLSIIEKYTQNEEDIKTVELDIAKQDMKQKLIQAIQEQKTQEQIDSMPSIQTIITYRIRYSCKNRSTNSSCSRWYSNFC